MTKGAMRWWGVAVLCAGITAPNVALAGWDKTEWGMSVEQVVALYPDATVGEDRREGGWHQAVELRAPTFAGVQWTRMNFRFDRNGRLSQVNLSASPDLASDIANRLVAQFGKPVEQGGRYSVTASFRDPARNNFIEFASSKQFVLVSYSPGNSGF